MNSSNLKSSDNTFIFSLESQNWRKFDAQQGGIAPGLYRAFFNVTEEPSDTFVDTQGWTKGVIFINGFNLGRFNKLGPQQRLYLPAPLLKKGQNTVSCKAHCWKNVLKLKIFLRFLFSSNSYQNPAFLSRMSPIWGSRQSFIFRKWSHVHVKKWATKFITSFCKPIKIMPCQEHGISWNVTPIHNIR